MNNKPYRDFSDFLADYFPGKMQKLTIDAGFTCPNRDGTLGRGGCSYCSNAAFSPGYKLRHRSIEEQIATSKTFFARKYPSMRYLVYFQSFTSTFGADAAQLSELYHRALQCDGVDGVIVGTRPDCMPDEVLHCLKTLDAFAMVEYGAESSHDATLNRVNRCHTWAQTVDAVLRTHDAGLPVGLHFILGLPGETRKDMLETVERINLLPVDVVKFHQLQVVRGTRMHQEYESGAINVARWSVDEYLDLCCEIVKRLRHDIAIDRFVSQTPADLLVAPRWGLKNYQFTSLLHRRLADCYSRL